MFRFSVFTNILLFYPVFSSEETEEDSIASVLIPNQKLPRINLGGSAKQEGLESRMDPSSSH